ncbi:hypothetical protein CHS0354_009602, partial [Potamilus streckersoni]
MSLEKENSASATLAFQKYHRQMRVLCIIYLDFEEHCIPDEVPVINTAQTSGGITMELHDAYTESMIIEEDNLSESQCDL